MVRKKEEISGSALGAEEDFRAKGTSELDRSAPSLWWVKKVCGESWYQLVVQASGIRAGELGREDWNLPALSPKVCGHHLHWEGIPATMAGHMPQSHQPYSLLGSARTWQVSDQVQVGTKHHAQRGVVIAESLKKGLFKKLTRDDEATPVWQHRSKDPLQGKKRKQLPEPGESWSCSVREGISTGCMAFCEKYSHCPSSLATREPREEILWPLSHCPLSLLVPPTGRTQLEARGLDAMGAGQPARSQGRWRRRRVGLDEQTDRSPSGKRENLFLLFIHSFKQYKESGGNLNTVITTTNNNNNGSDCHVLSVSMLWALC